MPREFTGRPPPERGEGLRLRAVREVEAGASPDHVATRLGLHRTTVYGWLARYRDGGAEALRAKPPPGRPPKFPDERLDRLLALMIGTTPRAARVDQELWTSHVVGIVIRREFDIAVSTTTVRRLLLRLGLPPPGHDRALRRRPDLPDIKIAARVNGATVHFATAEAGRALCDGRPTQVLQAIAADRGVARFAFYPGDLEPAMFVDFCRRLLADSRRPLYVVVACPSLRDAAVTREITATAGERIRVFPPREEGVPPPQPPVT